MGDLHKLGPRGESEALRILKKRGHRLLQRNFRCPQGEIDLITWDRGVLVFSEVRTRSPHEHRSPADSITLAKQKKVVRAAHWYLAKRSGRQAPPPCRFDVIWVHMEKDALIDHGIIENAFGEQV